MQVTQVLHNFVGKSLVESGIRKTKINAITDMAEALLNQSSLTLTSLGRHLSGEANVKHKIKRIDRWLGNISLCSQLPDIYKALFQPLMRQRKSLEILVDWSGCCNWTEVCLRASLVYQGRSITIYQEVHSTKVQQKHSVHKNFLKNLQAIIPQDCKVLIITDRGFTRRWFNEVTKIGWDFLGRCAGFCHYQLIGEESWQPIKSLYELSSNRTKFIGKAKVGKTLSEKLQASLYLYKGKPKKRKAQRTRNKPLYTNLNEIYSKINKIPWVLVTSLSGGRKIASQVRKKYATRMQIEQNFRDDKNERWGFGLQLSRTTSTCRLSILLLIASIASYILLLIGVLGETLNLHRLFQANTVKDRRVLSFLTLGKQIIRHMTGRIKMNVLLQAFDDIADGRSYEFFR